MFPDKLLNKQELDARNAFSYALMGGKKSVCETAVCNNQLI